MKLLGISGSLRKASTNTLLVHEAARLSEFSDFELGNIRMPLYDGDLEAASGVPEEAQLLAAQMRTADAVVISTPEYNKGISGSLKNALDWVSRTKGGPWAGKPVAIMSAAAGRAGGERAQFDLRLCMVPFRPRILQGPEVLVAACHNEFDEAGQLKTDSYVDMLTQLMDALKAEVALTR